MKTRHNYAGVLSAGRLRVRGAMLTTVDGEGAEISRVFDKAKSLMLNIGDRVVVGNETQIASCIVASVDKDGTPVVAATRGEISDGKVWVMPAQRATPKSKRKVA